jgi:rhomboid family GlyGly-CTERM serine protease
VSLRETAAAASAATVGRSGRRGSGSNASDTAGPEPGPDNSGPRLWVALALALAIGALAVWFAPTPRTRWDWQPGLSSTEPWRAWTAVWVHLSLRHLVVNLVGTALVAWLGWAACLPARSSLAWLLAWPLTQWGLALEPGLTHYGGLSGVLHAGVAVATVPLLAQAGRGRWVGALLLIGLAIKIAHEQPWGPPVRWGAEWDIGVAPLAHATGALSGLVCALLLQGMQWWRMSRSGLPRQA